LTPPPGGAAAVTKVEVAKVKAIYEPNGTS
jgi:hypothetical protein